jgi:hypothetical protein
VIDARNVWLIRRFLARMVAVAIVASLFVAARAPVTSAEERASLAARFSFTSAELVTPAGSAFATGRIVHPSLARIAGWISSVGAAAGLADLDGDGLENDICWVDPRTDTVNVLPAPAPRPAPYAAFVLEASSGQVDPAVMAPMGCLPGDVNEDGRPDLLVYYWGRPPLLFLHRGTSVMSSAFEPVDIVDGNDRWYSNAATYADLDGDGHQDLMIGNYFPDGARILDARGEGIESMQHSMSRAFNGGRDRLLRATGTGGAPWFTDVSDALSPEVADGWTLAVGAADLNHDLLPELYFANDFGPDRLLLNTSMPGHVQLEPLRGEKTLTVPNSKVLGQDSFKGMGVDFGDINGDGFLDMFVSNIADDYALEESNFAWVSTGAIGEMASGKAPYVDLSEPLGLARSGWGWDARLADFDNDGALEAVQATGFLRGAVDRWPELQELAIGNDELLADPRAWPQFVAGDDLSGHALGPFYVRDNAGRFTDVAKDVGLGEPRISRALAIGDVNGDGRLDMVQANQWEPSYLYVNESATAGSFLGLRVIRGSGAIGSIADGTPRGLAVDVIGASVDVVASPATHLTAEVDGGSGHSGKRARGLVFGLGQDAQLLEITVRWRDGLGVHEYRTNASAGWHTIRIGVAA